MNDQFKDLKEFSLRVMRDTEEFSASVRSLQRRDAGESPADLVMRTGQVIVDGATVLMELTLIRAKVARLFEDEGKFELAATRRHMQTELTEVIQSVRSALSAVVERSRGVRDLSLQAQKRADDATEV